MLLTRYMNELNDIVFIIIHDICTYHTLGENRQRVKGKEVNVAETCTNRVLRYDLYRRFKNCDSFYWLKLQDRYRILDIDIMIMLILRFVQ